MICGEGRIVSSSIKDNINGRKTVFYHSLLFYCLLTGLIREIQGALEAKFFDYVQHKRLSLIGPIITRKHSRHTGTPERQKGQAFVEGHISEIY